MRSNHKLVDGHVLASTLVNYTEPGFKYDKTIQDNNSSNKLRRLDNTQLAKDSYVLSSLR